MSQLFKFPSWPQNSHIPCSNRDVPPTSNFLYHWYTSGIFVTYVPVCNSRRSHCYPGLRQIHGIKVLLLFFIMVFQEQRSAGRSPYLSRMFVLTTAEIHDNCMTLLGHEHMAVDSTSSSALDVTSSRKTSAQWCCNSTTPN